MMLDNFVTSMNQIYMKVLNNLLLLTINNKKIFKFMRDLRLTASVLRNEEYDYYIEILILKVEKELNNN